MGSNSNVRIPPPEDSNDLMPKPKRLKTLAFDTTFTEGFNLLHQFVISNSDPNHVISEICINAVLVSMSGSSSINELNNDGYSALHLAVLKNNLLMVRKMLSCLRNLDVNTRCGVKGNKNTALHLAIKLGHLPIIKELLNEGAAIDSINCYGQTPLFLAVETGDLDAINILLRNGANIDHKDDVDDKSPLHFASKLGNLEVIRLLISKGADLKCMSRRGYTILHCAAESGNLDSVKYLVHTVGADINAGQVDSWTPFHCATLSGNWSIMKFLLDEGFDFPSESGGKLLLLAVKSNNLQVVRFFVEKGVDVNVRRNGGITPLHLAAESHSLAVLEYLISRGAHVDSKDYSGQAPPHYAIKAGNVEIFKILIESCSDMNIRDGRNNTLLHHAANDGMVDILEILVGKIEKEVDINCINGYKETPLHRAVSSVKPEIVKLLVRKGANLNAKEGRGGTPLHCAVGVGPDDNLQRVQDRLEIIAFLIGHGADVNSENLKGHTPLLLAMYCRNIEAAKLLATKDYDFSNFDSSGQTFLHKAVINGEPSFVKMAIERGANVNAVDREGQTPLHLCMQIALIQSNRQRDLKFILQMMKFFLEGNADINIEDRKGETPLRYGMQTGISDLTELLSEFIKNQKNMNVSRRTAAVP